MLAVFRQAVERTKEFGFRGPPIFAVILALLALLNLSSSAFGQSAADSVIQMNVKVSDLLGNGQYEQALELETKSLALARSSLGMQSSFTADCFEVMGQLYERLGGYTNAEASYRQSLQIRESFSEKADYKTAQLLDDLGILYTEMGRYNDAEPLLLQALTINEQDAGPGSGKTGRSLSSLGNYYDAIGDYPKAEDYDKQTLALDESLWSTNRPNTAIAMNNLANLDMDMGNYSDAEPLLEEVLAIDERLLGNNHPQVGQALQSLGSFYLRIGDYSKAESYYDRSRQILESTMGEDSPDTAVTLGGLAMLYMDLGDYEKAAPLVAHTLSIDIKSMGTNNPTLASMIGQMASLYARSGNFAAAIKMGEWVLKVDQTMVGPESPATAQAMLSLGMICLLKGDYGKAKSYDEEAMAIQRSVLPSDHPDVAAGLAGLAGVYAKRGDYGAAVPLQEQAAAIDERVLGLDNPSTANLLSDLSVEDLDLGKTNEALDCARKVEQSRLGALNNILSFTSEQQRLNYESQIDPYILFATLNDAPDLALAVLRHKGVVLDSLLEDKVVTRASTDPEYQSLIEQLEPAKRRLTQLTMMVPKTFSVETLSNRFNEYEKLSDRVDELEGTLARNVAGFGQVRSALGVTVAQVQQTIPAQAVLIEYIAYNQYLGRGKFEKRYGAVVFSDSGNPQWVCLGSAKDIEKNILNYQVSVRLNQEGKLSRALHNLYGEVWRPLEATFPPGTKMAIVSPGGALNFVSFATLMTGDNRFLAEKYSFRYVASGRDLLRQPVTPLNQHMVVFASPDYVAGGMVNWQSSIQLEPLPYFESEAIDLANQVKQWGWSVDIYTGDYATKQQVRALQSPWILQFSTHGFVLPALIKGPEKYSLLGFPLDSETPVRVVLRNPMSRSCIALAGAQVTLDAWQRGEVPATENDGVLTAEEVGELNLQGTWLVVLSACDTGIGELWTGEGVLGLRRGFVQAGAQNLLMTLWPIYDVSSSDIIKDFYVKLHDDNNPPQALAEVQRDWMVKLRAKDGLLSAVALAGPFIISSQGPVE
jgi:tetratricopeptide (TPR) repeat protein